jgi:hypothetical protein
MRVGLILCSLASIASSSPALAQRPRANAPLNRPRAARAADPQERAQMERRIRQRFYEVVRQRAGLDDNQMRKLNDVNGKYEPRRRDLLRDENETRRALRAEMAPGGTPDEAKVSAGLAKLQEIQRRRFEIDDQEQRDLASFMTPVQRARYHALREQLRRRLEQARQQHRENQLTDDSVPPAPLP